MKVKLKDLYPNPYKKWIEGGKLHQDQIDSIKANLDKLGLMDAIPVVKINGKYHIVSHHHRVEALKQMYGNDYEVDVVERKYDSELMCRGMVIENLTQRSGDFRQIKENLALIKQQLNEHPEWLSGLYIYKPHKYTGKTKDGQDDEREKHQHKSQGIGYWQIYRWIHNIDTKEKEDYLNEHKKAKNQMISFATIAQTIQIDENLDEELKEQVEKKHDKNQEERDEGIGHTLAVALSSFDNKEEQKDLAKALKNSKEGRVREQIHLISVYKKSILEIKQLIRLGLYDIKYIEVINKAFLILGKENVDKVVLNKIISISDGKVEQYLNGLKEIIPELRNKVIESDLGIKDIEKLGEFEEPEQQEEILDLYEQKSEEDDELFEDVVDKYKDIAKGEKPPEIEIETDPNEKKLERVEDLCSKIKAITPISITSMKNEKYKRMLINKLKNTENYIHKLLVDIGEYKVVE